MAGDGSLSPTASTWAIRHRRHWQAALLHRSISRLLAQLGLSRRRFIDPNGENNRVLKKIIAKYAGHTVHLDMKKAGHVQGDHASEISIRMSARA